jgi:hypothetical protein
MAVRDEAEMRAATLRQLELQLPVDAGKDASETVEVVSTILGPHDDEEMEEAPMRESLAHHLAHRAVRDIQKKAAGRTVVGIAVKTCHSSDEGDCEGDEGEVVHTWQADRRCYRIVLQVAVQ